MSLALSRPYPSRYGVPVLDRVDPRIFTLTYFGRCMECTFCHDACCQYGADVEGPRLDHLLAVSGDLEGYLGVDRATWFRLDPDDVGVLDEPEYPGGRYTRTAVVPLPAARAPFAGEACVFLDPAGRGCRLHRYALDRNVDPHDLKPMMCFLFPLTFHGGTLLPTEEFDDDPPVCTGPGLSLFRGAEADLHYYFGPKLVAELARIEPSVPAPPGRKTGAVPLAVVPRSAFADEKSPTDRLTE